MSDQVTDRKPGDDPPAGTTNGAGTPGGLFASTTPSAPPRGDPAPRRPRGRPKGSKTRAKAGAAKAAAPTEKQSLAREDQKLIANLKVILELPVIPARQVGFAFGVAHFSEQAHPTAEMIVKASRDWPELRNALTNAETLVSGKVLLAVAVVGYLAPVGAYLMGNQTLAYGISKATPVQVDAIENMMTLPPKFAAALQDAQESGASDAELQRMVESFYAQGTQRPSTPEGPAPAEAGATAATPAS